MRIARPFLPRRSRRFVPPAIALAIFVLCVGHLDIARAQLFLPNYDAGTIAEYTTSGAVVNETLVRGLTQPWALAVEGDSIFVACPMLGTVGEYSTTGKVVNATLISGLAGPIGIAVQGNDLFVANFYSGTIGEYTTSGAVVNASLISTGFPQGRPGPTALVADGNNLFVTFSSLASPTMLAGMVGEYTTSGDTVEVPLISGLEGTQAIAVEDNDLFVSDPFHGTVSEYTASGDSLHAPLISGLVSPVALAIDGNDLFVVSAIGSVGEYTTSGDTINPALISGLGPVYGIAVAVPEPAVGSLLLIASAGMLTRRKHRA